MRRRGGVRDAGWVGNAWRASRGLRRWVGNHARGADGGMRAARRLVEGLDALLRTMEQGRPRRPRGLGCGLHRAASAAGIGAESGGGEVHGGRVAQPDRDGRRASTNRRVRRAAWPSHTGVERGVRCVLQRSAHRHLELLLLARGRTRLHRGRPRLHRGAHCHLELLLLTHTLHAGWSSALIGGDRTWPDRSLAEVLAGLGLVWHWPHPPPPADRASRSEV